MNTNQLLSKDTEDAVRPQDTSHACKYTQTYTDKGWNGAKNL